MLGDAPTLGYIYPMLLAASYYETVLPWLMEQGIAYFTLSAAVLIFLTLLRQQVSRYHRLNALLHRKMEEKAQEMKQVMEQRIDEQRQRDSEADRLRMIMNQAVRAEQQQGCSAAMELLKTTINEKQ